MTNTCTGDCGGKEAIGNLNMGDGCAKHGGKKSDNTDASGGTAVSNLLSIVIFRCDGQAVGKSGSRKHCQYRVFVLSSS